MLREIAIATTAAAMNSHNAGASRIAATTTHASRTAVATRAARTTMSGATSAAQAPTMHFTGVSAFRSNTVTGNTWSKTGAATT